MDVLGVDHIDLTVNDLARSAPFYEKVLGALGFRRVPHATYLVWANAHLAIGLRAAAPPRARRRSTATGSGSTTSRSASGAGTRWIASTTSSCATGSRSSIRRRNTPSTARSTTRSSFADPDGMKLEVVHFPWGYWRRVQSEG